MLSTLEPETVNVAFQPEPDFSSLCRYTKAEVPKWAGVDDVPGAKPSINLIETILVRRCRLTSG